MRRERALKVLLVLVGLIFLFAVYPLMIYLWPSGWRWQPNRGGERADDPWGLCHARSLPPARLSLF
jgi:hypothetical protein